MVFRQVQMRFHYAGKYSGNEEDLPQRDPMPEGAVQFRESESTFMMSVIASVIGVVLFVALYFVILWRVPSYDFFATPGSLIAMLLALAASVPHEFMHAMWFREDLYMYSNLRQGMLFVVGPEDMGKWRFIWMSVFPALVLGVLPFVAFLLNPAWTGLGVFGAMSFVAASGDFINVFNALMQMPAGSQTFLSGMHSYWYLPK